jgi:hypothetical protein
MCSNHPNCQRINHSATMGLCEGLKGYAALNLKPDSEWQTMAVARTVQDPNKVLPKTEWSDARYEGVVTDTAMARNDGSLMSIRGPTDARTCADACAGQEGCQGFYHNAFDNMCSLLGATAQPMSPNVVNHGAVYAVKRKVQPKAPTSLEVTAESGDMLVKKFSDNTKAGIGLSASRDLQVMAPGGLHVNASDGVKVNAPCVEVGGHVSGKEVNAGKICYKNWSDGLDIVGAGVAGAARKVRVWDDLDVGGRMNARELCAEGTCVSSSELTKMKQVSNAPPPAPPPPPPPPPPPTNKMNGADCFEFGAGVAGKEVNAGKVCYNAFNTGGLDIVGAGAPGAMRRVTVWDDLVVRGQIRSDNRFVKMGVAPNTPHPNWGGGLHAYDVYVTGSVGWGKNGGVARWVNSDGMFNMSDRRTKKDILPLTADRLKDVKPVSFKKKDDPTGKVHFGVIAQDVQAAYPNLVNTKPDGMLAVNYEGFIPLILAELQELRESRRASRH